MQNMVINCDFFVGLLWYKRSSALKICILILFLSNMLYFALQYVKLVNTVQRLEAKLLQPCNKILDNEPKDGESKKINEEEPPPLEYSKRKYYPFIFNEPNKCNDDNLKPLPVFLLIVIKSMTTQFDRRRSIRLTWGNESNVNGIIIRRIFLLAKGNNDKLQVLLEREAEEFADIIQGDFHDSFRNLTIKDIMFMRWMITYCSQVKFIFKGDDDVFVNIDNIIDYLLSLSPKQAKYLFTGSVLYPSPRISDPKSKYYVSTNLWSEKYYPPYVSGGGFLMSSLVSKKIFQVTKTIPLIPIDDAFLGVCLEKLGLKPQNHKGFKSWGVKDPKDICVYQEIMTLHRISSDEMLEMWKNLRKTHLDFTDCATAFKIVKDKGDNAMAIRL